MKKKTIKQEYNNLFLCASCGGVEISERLYLSNPREHDMVRLTLENGTNKVISTEPDGIGGAIAWFNKRNPNRRNLYISYCSRDDHELLNSKKPRRKTVSRV